jgi:hypothetical protein
MPQLRNLIEGLNLGKGPARDELDRVLAIPEVESILGRDEDQALAQRRSLIERLASAPKRHAKAIAQAAKLAEEGRARVLEADAAFFRARAELVPLASAEHATQYGLEKEIAEINQTLRAGRDRRLDDLLLHFHQLQDTCRHLGKVWPSHEGSRLYGNHWVKYHSNLEDMGAAQAALKASCERVEQWAHSAISKRDLTEQMALLCAGLEEVLFAKVELHAPTIDEYGEVKAPIHYTGRVADLVKEPKPEPKS